MSGGRERALVWFRRDLRDYDHAALAAASAQARDVYCAFVFDRAILDALPTRADRRVDFIHRSVVELDRALRARGGGLVVRHGGAADEIPALAASLRVDAVYAGRDYEPYARERDAAVETALRARGVDFVACKEHVIFDRDDVLSNAGTPFTVFTPYRRAWLARLDASDVAPRGVRAGALRPPRSRERVPPLESIGFERTDLDAIGVAAGMDAGAARWHAFRARIDDYAKTRDYPSLDAPSRLSVDLRFGTVSIRELVRFARQRSLAPGGEGAAAWLDELVWREFFAQVLWHHPRVEMHAFRPQYDALAFGNDAGRLDAWREGRTGYPIVDAAMRELARTGYMHNRLRMVAASFLVKDLLVDWRCGERHFAERLLDFDLASNNGNWQWAASTGCDAQPWFRVFNPVTQSQRFDPDGRFIRRHVPELAALDAATIHAPWRAPPEALAARGVVLGRDYPPPIVDHAASREAALALYERARPRGRG